MNGVYTSFDGDLYEEFHGIAEYVESPWDEHKAWGRVPSITLYDKYNNKHLIVFERNKVDELVLVWPRTFLSNKERSIKAALADKDLVLRGLCASTTFNIEKPESVHFRVLFRYTEKEQKNPVVLFVI